MHASLLGFCLESLIIDNDMLGQCMRCVRGIEVNDQTIGIQVMKDVCMGCLLYTSPSPRDQVVSRMPSSA